MVDTLDKMFTKEEAQTFLQNTWGITNVKERLKTDRKTLLDEIVTATLSKVPFQSITLMAKPADERKLPTYQEIKQDCMTGVGGLCYSLNTFICGLLKGLGFSAEFLASTVTSTVTSPDNHLVILVRDVLEDGDAFLVDCGTGFPIFRAVPLDFDQESPIYKDGFLEYKFIRHDGEILRMHGAGDLMKRNDPPIDGFDFIVGRWRRFYSFDQDRVDPDRGVHLGNHYQATVICTPFVTSPRALWFPRKRLVAVVNNRFIAETEEGKLEKTILDSEEEVVKCLCDNFPVFSQHVARNALIAWHKHSAK